MAHEYTATIQWQRGSAAFLDNRYSRVHQWRFDGGVAVTASSSPSIVPLPMSDTSAVDPEEAFVAALSSCHMLWFLGLAAKKGLLVDSYVDEAVGFMQRRDDGKLWMAKVELRPKVDVQGAVTDAAVLDDLHHQAHVECFLANSVKTEVVVTARR
jgi:organic hydroperoxide reductase OsmC/OhrA